MACGRIGVLQVIVLSLVVVTASGCLLYRGDRHPDLVGSGAKPTASGAPRIDVVLHHRHTMDGKDAGGQATEATLKSMREAWERVRQETPFLANAGSGVPKPDFVLDLETEVAEHGKVAAIVSGATLGLVPAFISSDVNVKGTLKNLLGETVATGEGAGQLKGVFHLLLLPILPIVPAIAPGKELFDDTFRDVLIQITRAVEAGAPH